MANQCLFPAVARLKTYRCAGSQVRQNYDVFGHRAIYVCSFRGFTSDEVCMRTKGSNVVRDQSSGVSSDFKMMAVVQFMQPWMGV